MSWRRDDGESTALLVLMALTLLALGAFPIIFLALPFWLWLMS